MRREDRNEEDYYIVPNYNTDEYILYHGSELLGVFETYWDATDAYDWAATDAYGEVTAS